MTEQTPTLQAYSAIERIASEDPQKLLDVKKYLEVKLHQCCNPQKECTYYGEQTSPVDDVKFKFSKG